MAAINGTKLSEALIGTLADDTLSGLDGNDTLLGLDGNDRLDGGKGADLMDGGEGSDIYDVDSIGDVVRDSGVAGFDAVRTRLSYSLVTVPSIEGLQLVGSEAINGDGNSLDNLINGNFGSNRLSGAGGDDLLRGSQGNDTLDGGNGKDSMVGGDGNDTLIVDNALDSVEDSSGADTVISSVSFSLAGTSIENLILVAGFTDVQNGEGNTLSNRITGNGVRNLLDGGTGNDTLYGAAGNDILDGAAGADLLIGGEGSDLYVVDAPDRIQELIPGVEGGIDFVNYIGEGAFVLGANLENLEVENAALGIGNALDNNLFSSNAFGSELRGLAGNDILQIDVTIGGSTLDGGSGADFLRGGNSDDLFIVDNGGDFVVGLAGIDEIRTNLSVIQEFADVENYTFTGGAVSFSTDSSLANNKLTGTKFADFLSSNFGHDDLFGRGGNDTLFGGINDDDLDGGAGADSMVGGSGTDFYFVDNAKDVVDESSAGDLSLDTVFSAVSFSLAAATVLGAVEWLELSGSGAINGTGNSQDNRIIGNASSNKLDGGDGADTLLGASGNDALRGGAGADMLNGDAGNDTLTVDTLDIANGGAGFDTLVAMATFLSGASDVEIYIISKEAGAASIGGDDGANRITGNNSANGILGRGGNDTIDGEGGDDFINAGAGQNRINVALGNDTVVSGAEGLPAHDVITGFDGNAAGGQDFVSLAQLLDDLGIAAPDRANRVHANDKGSIVEIRVDTDGDATFDLLIATLQTKDAITVGQDILV